MIFILIFLSISEFVFNWIRFDNLDHDQMIRMKMGIDEDEKVRVKSKKNIWRDLIPIYRNGILAPYVNDVVSVVVFLT